MILYLSYVTANDTTVFSLKPSNPQQDTDVDDGSACVLASVCAWQLNVSQGHEQQHGLCPSSSCGSCEDVWVGEQRIVYILGSTSLVDTVEYILLNTNFSDTFNDNQFIHVYSLLV